MFQNREYQVNRFNLLRNHRDTPNSRIFTTISNRSGESLAQLSENEPQNRNSNLSSKNIFIYIGVIAVYLLLIAAVVLVILFAPRGQSPIMSQSYPQSGSGVLEILESNNKKGDFNTLKVRPKEVALPPLYAIDPRSDISMLEAKKETHQEVSSANFNKAEKIDRNRLRNNSKIFHIEDFL